ncbi:hypothetical protein F5Y07DRAFT_340610 [Xylaria sp. FL0933]|nr:hypothetical protein F5Y07DRAFT_340610 [Xylaria sp. FL0933]
MPGQHFTHPFEKIVRQLRKECAVATQLSYLEALEKSLVDALDTLHSHNISFPISAKNIEYSRKQVSISGDLEDVRLFLPYNKNAGWASDSLPPTWKADQLSSARSIFFLPKLFARLAASSKPILLDFESQKALAMYFVEKPGSYLEENCLGIVPMTAMLAQQIAINLAMRGGLMWAEKSRKFLELFFGGPMPLPEPSTSIDTIYKIFSDLRARAIESEEHHRSSTEAYRDLQPKLLVDSPELVTRLLWCRTKIAFELDDSDKKQWNFITKKLNAAIRSSRGPSSRLEKVVSPVNSCHCQDLET